MITGMFGIVLVILLFTGPALLLPAIITLIILRKFSGDPLSRMIAAFTAKPLLATPLWALTFPLAGILKLSRNGAVILSLLPGIGLTLMLIFIYRHLLQTEMKITMVLLGVDALRWLNSFAWVLFPTGGLEPSLDVPQYVIGLILPTAYAMMAIVILWLRTRLQKQLA